MTFGTVLSVRLVVTDLDRSGLEQLFDDLAENLHAKESSDGPLLDSDVAMDFGTGRVEIFVTAVGTSPEAANATADRIVDAALRETGGQDLGGEPITYVAEEDLTGSPLTVPDELYARSSQHDAHYEVTSRVPLGV